MTVARGTTLQTAQLLLRRLLEQAGGAAEQGFVLVLDGEGLEQLPAEIATPRGIHGVHRVGSELGLRHLVWKLQGAPFIAVLPEGVARRIQRAPDLLRRARNQRVHALAIHDVLEVVLGVRVVGADAPHMQQLALDHLHALEQAVSQRTLPTVIDRKLLTELLVDVCVGDLLRTASPAQLLAAWCRQVPDFSEPVGRLVREFLPSLHGDEGRLLAWALDAPHTRPGDLVVHGAVLTVETPEIARNAWGPLWEAAREAPIELDRNLLRRVVSRLAEETLALLGEAAGPLLDRADDHGVKTLTPPQLQTSRVLPMAFADRCHVLARQAAEGRAVSASDISWLESHRAVSLHRAELGVLDAMARLSRYLDQPFAPRLDLLEQVRQFQREGAFADLAVTQLRRALASSQHHHAEAARVLAAVRERRDRENEAFARTLAAGYESCLHHEGLTPLHRIWRRTVAPVWQHDPEARLYVVVLDGCSYPVFLELLQALSQDGVFPVGVRPDPEGRVSGLPALSPLPTVTSHARGALFLGELPSDPLVAETVFRDQDEARTDKARFLQNAGLGARPRKLFLKGDLADGGRGLLDALDDPALEIVAVVFNAVDDQIGSSNTGATVRIAPEDITGFKPSLRRALQAGRKVLLTADHGHSPYHDRSLRMGAGSTPRYMPLGPQDSPPDGYIELDLGGLGGPRERRAFAWRSGVYLGQPQVGFHGGCSLEEMVVPLAWVERDGLSADEPAWWFGSGAMPLPALASRPLAPLAPEPPPTDPPKRLPQLSLLDLSQRSDILPLPADVRDGLTADEKSVLVWLFEARTARASELAAKVNKNPVRFNGLMRTLRRTLHAAGHVLFEDEVLPDGETQYRFVGKEQP